MLAFVYYEGTGCWAIIIYCYRSAVPQYRDPDSSLAASVPTQKLAINIMGLYPLLMWLHSLVHNATLLKLLEYSGDRVRVL